MRVTVISIGKVREKYIKLGVDEFSKRLSRYCNLEFIEVNDEKIGPNPTEREAEIVRKKEADLVLSKIKDSMYVVAMDLDGKMMNSEDLAKRVKYIATYQKSHIAFVIGGSLGLSNLVKARADLKLSFSKMTFPHQLFKLLLLEQIYRAFKINNNEVYHK